jgi:hypothetical protein
MANIFCPSCGAKAEYQFSAPNFCHKCGLPYSQGVAVAKSHLLSSRPTRSRSMRNELPEVQEEDDSSYEDDDSDSTNVNRVPRLSKIQVEIDSSTDIRSYKFEDFLSGNSSSFKKPRSVNLDDLLNERS